MIGSAYLAAEGFESALAEELTRRGVAFFGAPHVIHRTPEIEISLAEFRDPDGNPLALMAQSKAA